MTNLNAYLTFSGNCEEAINFYKDCLGGEILSINYFEGSPMEVPEEYKKKVMHVTLKFEDCLLMASDNPPRNEIINGNNFSLTIGTDDLKKGDDYFEKLSSGGNVIMSMQETFWAPRFGMLTDKFGINWMINCETKK